MKDRTELAPVAWRWRYKGTNWIFGADKPSWPSDEDEVVEPLYGPALIAESAALRTVTPELAAEFANIDGPWTRGQMTMEEVWSRLIDAQLEAVAALQQEKV